MHARTLITAVGFLLVASSIAQAETPLIGQRLLNTHTSGRMAFSAKIDKSPQAVRIVTTETYQWPGTYMETAFDGPEVSLQLNDSANILNVLIDHQVKETLNRPGEVVKTYKDLGPGQHVIRLERLTETQDATGTFAGFFAPDKGPVLAVRTRTKQIEFIGDSYTVGYGNTAGKRSCTRDEIWVTTDTSKAFGPLTAKHYNADYQINAYSGRGIVRNYDGFAGDTLPGLYPYALFDGKTIYNDPSWSPQVITIALGTNDFSTPVHAGEKWKTQDELTNDYEATYVSFVKSLRAKNPNATILLISYDLATSPAISTVRDRLKADGDGHVDFLEITGFTKNACDYHPDTSDDRKISDTLIAYFDAHPGIWQGK